LGRSLDLGTNSGICDVRAIPGNQIIDATDDRNGDMKSVDRRVRRNNICPQQSVRELVDLCPKFQHRNPAQQRCTLCSGSDISARRPAVLRSTRKALVLIEQAQEAQLPEHGSGHGRVHMTRPGIPPRSTTVEGGCPRTSLVEAMPAKFTVPGPWPLPLPPHDAAQFAAKPLIQILEARLRFCQGGEEFQADQAEALAQFPRRSNLPDILPWTGSFIVSAVPSMSSA
jgi:hypothetical protein